MTVMMIAIRTKSMPTAFKMRYLCLFAVGLLSGCATFQPRPISPAGSLGAYESRSLGNPGLVKFLVANHVAWPGSGQSWDLKALTLAAFYYQPALAYARAQLLSAQAARITARARPNPSLSLSPGYDSGVPAVPSPWIVPVALDWPIETAGRRGDRMAEARHLAAAARWDLVGTVWGVRSRLRGALLSLYTARQTESLLAQQVSALQRVFNLLEGQFRAGVVSSYDVTRARIALDNATLARQAQQGRIREARIALASAIGVPVSALRGVHLSFAGFTQFPRDLTRPAVRQQALLGRSDVRAALAQYAASQSALKLEVARQWPNIALGPGYAWNSQLAGDREWQLGLSLTLPVLNQNQGPIAEARARRRVAAAQFLGVQSAAVAQIDGALAAYRSTLGQVRTAESLLGNLRRQLKSIRAQVNAGELQPLDLANAEVAFFAGAQNRLAARIAAQQALGALQDAVQSPLTLRPSLLQSAQNTPHSTRP